MEYVYEKRREGERCTERKGGSQPNTRQNGFDQRQRTREWSSDADEDRLF